MITGKDVYDVIAAIVPLYVAMFLAYGSVRWWGVFSPDQCSGINRFVAVFAVPLLSFHFISSNDPYAMNYQFLAADSLQKLVILFSLFLWHSLSPRLLRSTRWAHHTTSLDWTITLFSLCTLPNTLVMGIPLLRAMYGDFSADLMVQIVVLQSVIWYTLLLFLFEYRAAKSLIQDQFPGVAASIASFRVDSDVVSLAAGDGPLDAEAEVGEDGKLHVKVRRSNPGSRTGSFVQGRSYAATPRTSNLTGVEIYSLQSSREPTPRGSSFNQADFFAAMSGGRTANASPWNGPTGEEETGKGRHKGPGSKSVDFANCAGGLPSSSSAAGAGAYPPPNPTFSTPAKTAKEGGAGKELHMFVWSSTASPASETNMRQAVNRAASVDFASVDPSKFVPAASKALHASSDNPSPTKKAAAMANGGDVTEIEEGVKTNGICVSMNTKKVIAADVGGDAVLGDGESMPPTKVMTRLIVIMVWRKLIRNPNTYASLFGLLWSFISFRLHIKMPSVVHGSITILSDAGLGMAMFSLGLFMALQPKIIACGNSVAAFSMAVRFLTGPAVIAATSIAIGVRGVLLHVAIVQAALPQGIVPFVFAKEYSCYPDILSTAVIFGMLISLPITILYYVLLGV